MGYIWFGRDWFEGGCLYLHDWASILPINIRVVGYVLAADGRDLVHGTDTDRVCF